MMKRIVESTVNNILDKRMLSEAGELPSPEPSVYEPKSVTTSIGVVSADGTKVSGGIAGLGGDPSPITNYIPPVVNRIDVPGLNKRFWDWFKKYHDGEDEYEG